MDSVPILGELLLDDFKVTKPENYEHLNENIEVVQFTVHKFSSIYVGDNTA